MPHQPTTHDQAPTKVLDSNTASPQSVVIDRRANTVKVRYAGNPVTWLVGAVLLPASIIGFVYPHQLDKLWYIYGSVIGMAASKWQDGDSTNDG